MLSGGGAKSAAHIGAARAFAEAGLSPVRYVATSMGAVIAAALSAGVSGEVLLARLAEVGRSGVVQDPLAFVSGLFARSLLRPDPFRQAVERLVPARRFAELAVPVTVTVTDLDTGELLLFGAGGEDAPLLDVLCASCALPVYYPPVSLGGRRCADGGLRGPLPLDVAARWRERPSWRWMSGRGSTSPDRHMSGACPPSSARTMRRWAPSWPTRRRASSRSGAATPARPPLIYVRPQVERAATFKVERVRKYADDGYAAARDALASAVRP